MTVTLVGDEDTVRLDFTLAGETLAHVAALGLPSGSYVLGLVERRDWRTIRDALNAVSWVFAGMQRVSFNSTDAAGLVAYAIVMSRLPETELLVRCIQEERPLSFETLSEPRDYTHRLRFTFGPRLRTGARSDPWVYVGPPPSTPAPPRARRINMVQPPPLSGQAMQAISNDKSTPSGASITRRRMVLRRDK